jgi:hypothetical protein
MAWITVTTDDGEMTWEERAVSDAEEVERRHEADVILFDGGGDRADRLAAATGA